MVRSSIMIDLDDPRTEKIADVISNKTAKKIVSILTDGELSEAEIASKLSIPTNTVEYNIKKLEGAGLIEKTGGYFWSVKGKRIHRYRVSNKKIIISPKSLARGIIPAVIGCILVAIIIKIFVGVPIGVNSYGSDSAVMMKDVAIEGSSSASRGAIDMIQPPSQVSDVLTYSANSPNSWAWFMLGSLMALLIVVFWNYKERMKGGNENG